MAKPRRMRAYPVTVARARRQAEKEQTMRTWTEQLARIKELETERNGAIDDVMRAEADRDSQRRRGNAYRNRALALVRALKWKREQARGSVLRAEKDATWNSDLSKHYQNNAIKANARAAALEAQLADARALLVRARYHISSDDDPLLADDMNTLLAAHPAPAAGEQGETGETDGRA